MTALSDKTPSASKAMILKNYGCVWYHTGRKAVPHFDDMDWTDECQLEVYLYALGLMKKHGLRSVADVGCGSAYKLITYLGDYDTLGLEVAANIPVLRARYPGRQFAESDFQGKPPVADVVICSDVIEHLTDPDALLRFLRRATCRFLIIATPVRIDKLRFLWQKPKRLMFPGNIHHVREWKEKEFSRYLSAAGFQDFRHEWSMPGRQMVVCKGESLALPELKK